METAGRLGALGAALLALLLGGCLDNPGIDPPPGRFAFPVAVGIAPAPPGEAPSHLFVASSNFDLHYNAGALHAIDLEALGACEDCRFESGCLLVPEQADPPAVRGGFETRRCPGLLASEVLLDSFASDLAVSPDGRRLYVAVRSRANLTVIDVAADGRLDCGGPQGERHRCGPDRRVDGSEPGAALDERALPADPVALLAAPAAEAGDSGCVERVAVWMAHRGGQVSLFLDEGPGSGLPRLLDVTDPLARGLSGIAPRGGGVVWAPSRVEGTVARVATAIACGEPARAELRPLPALPLQGLDTAGTSPPELRAVAIDADGEAPLAFAVSRDPRALLAIDVVASERTGRLVTRWSRPACPGASELRLGRVEVGEGVVRRLLWLSCFDAQRVEAFDARDGRHLGSLRELSGPYDFALDPARRRLYVADFAASVLRVYDAEDLLGCLGSGDGTAPPSCEPRLRTVVGVPTTVRELR